MSDAIIAKRHRNRLNLLSRFVKWRTGKQLRSSRAFLSQMTTMQELKDELRLLTSYSTDTVYRLRYDTMRYDYISSSVHRLLGYTVSEIRRLPFRSLILETRIVSDNLKKVETYAQLEELRQSGEVGKWQADYLMRRKDGKKIWVSDVSYPWVDRNGNILGSIGSLRDITERVEAEKTVREEISRLLHTDALTGLATRKVFFQRLEDEMKRVKRSRGEMSLMVIDIDDLKRINHLYGQMIGDFLIQQLTGIIKTCLRETDTLARIGGEEFGIILPETSSDSAYWVAERIRTSVAQHVFTQESGALPVTCTISLGLAGARFDDHVDASKLYEAADNQMSLAKHKGRNNISMGQMASMH